MKNSVCIIIATLLVLQTIKSTSGSAVKITQITLEEALKIHPGLGNGTQLVKHNLRTEIIPPRAAQSSNYGDYVSGVADVSDQLLKRDLVIWPTVKDVNQYISYQFTAGNNYIKSVRAINLGPQRAFTEAVTIVGDGTAVYVLATIPAEFDIRLLIEMYAE